MNTKGIRISDIREGKCIPLTEILEGIPHVDRLNWALLWCEATPIQGEGKWVVRLQKEVNGSKDGLTCTFELLKDLSRKIFQEVEVLIIGSRIKKDLHRYDEDQKMYENCDVVIEMIDGGFWEIFSKDADWIHQLTEKYEVTELLESDFQENL